MERYVVLTDMLILFGVATLVSVVLYRMRQSTVVAYLLTGVLVGPSGLAWVTGRESIELMAEIGVVLLLFTIGIEFSLKKLLRMRQVVLGAGSRQVGLTIAAALSLALALGVSWQAGLFWGFLVAVSSTAIVFKLLFERQELDTPHGRAIVGILLFQDLCVVPMMAMLPALAPSAEAAKTPAAVAGQLLLALGEAALVVGVILLVAHYVFPLLWGGIARLRNKEIFLIATIFFTLGTAWVAAEMGLSLALGAFLAGLALSESEFAHQILADILPFRDSFASLFFISVGMLVNLSYVWENAAVVGGLAAGLLLVKFLTGTGALLLMRFPLRIALLVGFALAQMGEFSFILLHQGLVLGLIGEGRYQEFLAAAVISMMVTPLMIQAAPAVVMRMGELRRLRRFFPEPGEAELEIKAHGLSDHVIVCGYGLNGRLTGEALRQAGVPFVVLDTNPETVRQMAADGVNIYFGDVSRQEILEKAGAAHARAIVFAISDPFVLSRAVAAARSLNPALAILARTNRVEDRPLLERAGASQVIAEEMEAAEEIMVILLELYGMPREEAFQQAHAIRRQKEADAEPR